MIIMPPETRLHGTVVAELNHARCCMTCMPAIILIDQQ